MALLEEKVNFVLWLAKLKCTAAVQRRLRTQYKKEAPHRNSISKWIKIFKQVLSMISHGLVGRVSEETVAFVEETFEASPKEVIKSGITRAGDFKVCRA